MIVNVRGTFGSGKSTIVRAVMERYPERRPAMVEGRKRPYGYTCLRPGDVGPRLWVVGHYETQCGGADTIPKIDVIYEQVRGAAERGYDVLFEGGALVQHDVRRTIEISKIYPLRVVTIVIPLELAISSVNARRASKGKEPLPDPKNIVKMQEDARRSDKRLVAAAVDVRRPETREEALALTLEALGWS